MVGGADAVRRCCYGALGISAAASRDRRPAAPIGGAFGGSLLVLVIGLEDAALLLQLHEESAATAYYKKEWQALKRGIMHLR